jgi:hypothetical protein
MFKAPPNSKLLLSSIITLFLVSCGGGGGGTSVSTPTAVSGYATKAPLTNATCTLYNVANQAVSSGQISSNGAVNFGQVSQAGYMTASCSGGTYTDEATGASATSTTMRSSVYVSAAGGSVSVVISPLTEMVMQRVGGSAVNAAAQASIVAKALGLDGIDILAITPTDLNTASASSNAQGRYGVVLAAFAQMMKDQGQTLDQLIGTFVTTTNASGSLRADVSNVLQAAINNLTDPTKNNNANVRANTNSTVTQAVLGTAGSSSDTTAFANSVALTTPVVSSAVATSPALLRVPMVSENLTASAALGAPANTVLTPIWGQTYTAVAIGGNLGSAAFKVAGMTCTGQTASADGKTLSAQCTMSSYGARAQIDVQQANQTVLGIQPSATYFFSNGASACANNTVVIGSISPLTAAYAEQGKAFTAQGCNLSPTANATLDGASATPEAIASADQVSYKWNITNTRVAGNTGSMVVQGKTQAIAYSIPTVTLTAVSPSTAIKGASAASNFTVTGTGLYSGMAVSLANAAGVATACTGGSANSTGTQLSGVNCSNVTYSLSANSAAMNVANNSGTAPNITLQDAPQSSLTLSVDKSSIQLGSTGALVSSASNSMGPISYSSSDASVAAVDAVSGVVTPVATGSVTITATQIAVVGQYAQTTKTVAITVTARTSPTLSFVQTSKTVTLGDSDFSNLIATKTCSTEANYNPAVTYSIASGGSFINLYSVGLVALKGAGSATVQASVAQVGTCAAQTVSYNITINKANPAFGIGAATFNVTYGIAPFTGNTAFFVGVINPGSSVAMPSTAGLVLSYSSSNPAVATVSNVGLITVVSAGSTTISARSSGDANYNAVTSGPSYPVTVSKAIPVSNPNTPTLYLDTDALGVAYSVPITGVLGAAVPTGSVTYTSQNTSILTVNASTGKLTPVSQGTANVNAYYLGDANYTALSTTVPITVLATAPILTTACTGVNCGATSATAYNGNGVGVWKLNNSTAGALTLDLDIANVVAGKAVTLAFTNGNTTAASSLPAFGTQASTEPLPIASPFNLESSRLHAQPSHHQAHDDAHSKFVERNRQLSQGMRSLPKPTNAETAPTQNTRSYAAPAVGATRNWVDYYSTPVTHASTAQSVCTLPNGRNVVFWKSNADTALTPTILSVFTTNMCGAGKGFDKLIGLIGDVWGVHAYPNYFISDGGTKQQDINIAFVNAGNTGWAGYFSGQNNYKIPNGYGLTNTNQALVFFVNTYSLASDVNFYFSTLIHEAKHMISSYQSDVLSLYAKTTDTWYEETSAMMAEDIIVNDLIGYNKMAQYRLPYYLTTGGGVSLNNWPNLSANNYAMGGTLGAFLNRRYGTGLLSQSIAGCTTGIYQASSYACVDGLIKSSGGIGLADELARMGVSVFAKLPASTIPAGVGYPAVTSNGFGLTAIDSSALTLASPWTLSAFSSMSQTYLNEVQAAGKTRYIRKNVTVPAGTLLYVVIR